MASVFLLILEDHAVILTSSVCLLDDHDPALEPLLVWEDDPAVSKSLASLAVQHEEFW